MGDLVGNYHDIFNVFKNKRVLVTGDTGFKGSWLSLWLKEIGADVVGYALPPERKNDHFNIIGLDKIIHHINGDIRDEASVNKVFDEFQPEVLFHLAAQPIVRYSYEEPKLTFDTNVGGSVNILEGVRRTKPLKALVYVTSDKCYRNKEWIWGYRENDELGGHDPYSASKAAAEIVFSSYLNSFFKEKEEFGAASVRAGNVIGGGDWAKDRIVPDSIKALMNNKEVVLRNPMATRPWQHVLEPLSGYMLLAARLLVEPVKYSGAWNFGPGEEATRTVEYLAESIIKYWGDGEIKCEININAPHEAGLLKLNCDKANNLLRWSGKWCFDKTVEETVRWYKSFMNDDKILKISREQINLYMGDTI